MNLNELFSQQKALDHRIVKEKGLEGVDLLEDKTVALICELYECVNENRHFKFWSENQEANNKKYSYSSCDECNGTGYHRINGEGECYKCDGSGRYKNVNYQNPLLEEYVDVVHFTLSIANDLGYHSHEYIHYKEVNLNKIILDLTNIATVLLDNKEPDHVWLLVNQVIMLGYELGFTEQQVLDAYYDKNKINHDRQSSGY